MLQEPEALRAERVIVLSDVHVDEWPRELPEECEAKRAHLRDFIRWVGTDAGAQHLVINGDLLDIPQKHGEPLLPQFADILDAFLELYQLGVGISYVIGNHDSGLLGFSTGMPGAGVTVNYPCLVVESGGKRIGIEHGHLLDAWLWTYVEQRLEMVCHRDRVEPAVAMHPFTGEPPGPGGPTLPSFHGVANDLFASLQWEPDGLNFTRDETRLAIRVMAMDLCDDFADVMAPGENYREQAEALKRLQELGIDPSALVRGENLDEAFDAFDAIGNAYYASIPWRRAARHRLRELSGWLSEPISAVVFGHVHKMDRLVWQENGREVEYVNDGSWKADRADYVYIQDGTLTLHRRLWTDPLP